MLRKSVFLILCIIVLQLAFCSVSSAQGNPGCYAYDNFWPIVEGPVPPGWFIAQSYWGPFAILIGTPLATCPPGGPPGPNPCPGCSCGSGGPSGSGSGGSGSGGGPPGSSASPRASKPVCLATGNTFIVQSDIDIPGLGGGLHSKRVWNSQWPLALAGSSIGLFGPNWRSTFEERVFMGLDHYTKYLRSDGSLWSFGNSSAGFIPAAPADVYATLTFGASSTVITFQNGEKRQFDPTTGNLTAIIDRNGNTTQLTYDSSKRLTTVTDPVSRHLYFNYPNGSSFLVSSVTSDFGVTLSYSYNSSGLLSQVTLPDLTTISYTYNAASLITSVTDSNGKTLESHTYDSASRGLTSSKANGVEAVTISY
jgi:YD repeat-containing protein